MKASPGLGSRWQETLTQEEIRAMEAEMSWAVRAKTRDMPGPTRIKVHVNRRGLPKPE